MLWRCRLTKILITGGAGFIGRRVASALTEEGYDVVALDALIDQVHRRSDPVVLPRGVRLIVGDVRDASLVRKALDGVEAVIYLAAEVGVGQSMYAIDRYVSANDSGTAILFEELARSSVRRIVVASSMSVYGEGLYRDAAGRHLKHVQRTLAPGRAWDPLDETGCPLVPLPTPETKPVDLASVYALTKYVQERLTLMLAAAYGMEGCALRLFNTFGPGQSLSNPYTGVLAIFASRLLNHRRPMVFEDGLQRRDFVHVDDVADAFAAALKAPEASGKVFNIGSGQSRSILEVAQLLATAMGKPDLDPEIIGKARIGDIRHCFADITQASTLLGFKPKRSLETSLDEFTSWLATQSATDSVGRARTELEVRGLVS